MKMRIKLLSMLAAPIVVLAGSAQAASAAATQWTYPGSHPFTGTPLEAATMHENAIGLPAADYMRGVAMFNANQCQEHYLQDGEFIQNTFTNNGVSRSVWTQVNFKDRTTGRPLAPNDPKRRSMRCRISGRTDGAATVYPYVCGNWGVQYLPPLPQQVPTPQLPMTINLRDYTAPTTHDVIKGEYPNINVLVVTSSSAAAAAAGSSGPDGSHTKPHHGGKK